MTFGFSFLGINKKKIKKIPWILASYTFLIMLFLILLDFLLGGYVYYRYIVLVKTQEPQVIERTMKFEYNAYAQILKSWEAKERIFQKPDDNRYINPFAS